MDDCLLQRVSSAAFVACVKMKTAIVWLFWEFAGSAG
jgi:hypothetical protein